MTGEIRRRGEIWRPSKEWRKNKRQTTLLSLDSVKRKMILLETTTRPFFCSCCSHCHRCFWLCSGFCRPSWGWWVMGWGVGLLLLLLLRLLLLLHGTAGAGAGLLQRQFRHVACACIHNDRQTTESKRLDRHRDRTEGGGGGGGVRDTRIPEHRGRERELKKAPVSYFSRLCGEKTISRGG